MNRHLATAFCVLIALCGVPGLPPGTGTATSAWASSGGDVEDSVEAEVEDHVDASVEDKVESSVEDKVESSVEDKVESSVEGKVESSVEDKVESDVEDKVETDVEDKVETDVEDKVETDVEDKVETDVEDKVETDVEDSVEAEAERNAEAIVEQQTENEIEDEIEGDAEGQLEQGVERGVAKEAGEEAAEKSKAVDKAEERSGRRATGQKDTSNERRSSSAMPASRGPDRSAAAENAAERFAGLGVDREGSDIAIGEWLVIATRDDVAALEELGYVARAVEPLEGLDRVLAYMEAPGSFDIAEAQAAIRRAAPDAEVDYNHVYRPETKERLPSGGGEMPAELVRSLATVDASSLSMGLIDTAIDADHPALRAARVQQRSFTPPDYAQPSQHGTSVLSILVGQAPDYRGLLPGAQVYAAAVFFVGPDGREIATTAGLVRALDWMTQKRVPVVNMSLAGPRNGILETAIDRAYESGTVVVAAVGNRGPTAAPLYPAASERVVAVTAVSSSGKIYRLANRGAQVDFAAPGVDVLHADGKAGYRASSGTSLAAPFVAAVIAASCHELQPFAACLQALQRNAEDLGDAGFDPVFGYGIIRPLAAGPP